VKVLRLMVVFPVLVAGLFFGLVSDVCGAIADWLQRALPKDL
jgi:hypothetical protein